MAAPATVYFVQEGKREGKILYQFILLLRNEGLTERDLPQGLPIIHEAIQETSMYWQHRLTHAMIRNIVAVSGGAV